MTAREVLKDAEDIEGDREGGGPHPADDHRCPQLLPYRSRPCSRGGSGAQSVTHHALVEPLVSGHDALADAVILFAVASSVRCSTSAGVRESGATKMLKTGMFAALAVLILWAMIG